MAQKWRSGAGASSPRQARPLDLKALDRIALRYVERYATSRAKLQAYLRRKLRERGWSDDAPPPVEALVERFAALGYVDDATFAAARGAGLVRRGYGPRRVAASLKAAGIDDADSAEARCAAENEAWTAALAFARRKRIGPFATAAADRPAREKAVAALLRAGHAPATARRIAWAAPGDVPEPDDD